MVSNKPLYVFVHIPKTGGTSLSAILHRQYGDKHLTLNEGLNLLNYQLAANVLNTDPERYDFISGHMSELGIHTVSSRPIYYITQLRHPVARAISQYYYILRTPNHRQYELFQSLSSLSDAVQYLGSNLQTRILSGLPPKATVEAEHLELAKQNLTTLFAAVGTLERFDETIILYKHRLNWDQLYIPVHSNIGSNKSKQIDGDVTAQLLEGNRYDLALWEFVNTLMDQQIKAIGFPYQRDYLTLRAKQKMRELRSTLKSSLKRALTSTDGS